MVNVRRTGAAVSTVLAVCLLGGCRAQPAMPGPPAGVGQDQSDGAAPDPCEGLYEALWLLRDATPQDAQRASGILASLRGGLEYGPEIVDPALDGADQALVSAWIMLDVADGVPQCPDRPAMERQGSRLGADPDLLAAVALASLGASAPVGHDEALRLHQSDDPAVRTWAAVGLGRLGDASGLGALRGALSGSNRWLAMCAASALGDLGSLAADAMPDIVRALAAESPPSAVRVALASALAEVAPYAKDYAPTALAELDGPSIPMRLAALDYITGAGPAARRCLPRLEALAAAARDTEIAALLLPAIGSAGSSERDGPRVSSVLRGFLDDRNPAARRAAAGALAGLGDPSGLPILTDCVASDDDLTVLSALLRLQALHDGAAPALPTVEALVSGRSERVTREAAATIAAIGSPRAPARASLLAMARERDRDPLLRAAAYRALASAGDRGLASEILAFVRSQPGGSRSQCAEALLGLDALPADACDAAVALLDDTCGLVRGLAAIALLRSGDATGADHACAILEVRGEGLRLAAAAALAGAGDERGVSALARLRDSADWWVRAEAGKGLAGAR